MQFLIQYHRPSGICTVQEFSDAQAPEAIRARFAAERVADPDIEVVVLVAQDLDTVRRTHSRYFHTVQELILEMSS